MTTLKDAARRVVNGFTGQLRRWRVPEGFGPLKTIPIDFYLRENPSKGYDHEPDASFDLAKVAANTMLSYERAITLHQQVRHLEVAGIAGSLVECGVWKGGAAGMMALANLRYGETRREVHLFDSFQGLPEPSLMDGPEVLARAERLSGRKLDGSAGLVPVGWDEASREDSAALFRKIGYPVEYVHYHEGWFQETLKRGGDLGPIALLRLDGDWYESTKVCLEALYPQVVRGGFAVIDDYGHWQGCRKAVDEYFQKNGLAAYLHHIDYTGRYIVKSSDG
jgi:hypothetical protein